MTRVFQGSKGRFTVGLRNHGTRVITTYALCRSKDQFRRKVGFHRVTGLFRAKPGTPNVLELGDYRGSDFHADIVKPLFNRLERINNNEFAGSSDRVDQLVEDIVFAFKDAAEQLQVVTVAD